MAKLVVLKLINGDFEQGFLVTLQIWEEGVRPLAETIGNLPPSLEILEQHRNWDSTYRGLGGNLRIGAPAKQVKNFSIADVNQAALVLKDSLNNWLNSERFRNVREKLL